MKTLRNYEIFSFGSFDESTPFLLFLKSIFIIENKRREKISVKQIS